MWVHTPEKVGRDAGELAGVEPLGIAATNDADALVALAPDCVVYAASGPERGAGAVPDYVRLLEAGINVVTTTSTELVYPPVADAALRERLSKAAEAGGASLYASGIFPGFASDELALLLDHAVRDIRSIRMHRGLAERPLSGRRRDDGRDGLRLARSTSSLSSACPGVIPMVWRAPIELIARGLGVELEEIRGRLDRELTDRDIEVAFGTIPAGTVGAVRTTASGIVDGREAIVIDHVIRMARDVAPDWPSSDNDATYLVSIEGDPDIECRLTLGPPEGPDAGEAAMTATAMRVVNAVPRWSTPRPACSAHSTSPSRCRSGLRLIEAEGGAR